MKPVLFADLDDTLFRSVARLGGDTTGMVQVTTATNGNHSWMDARQKRFVDWALTAMEVIPVTARSRDAFARVAIAFTGLAVIANGAVIVAPDGSVDRIWDDRIRAISRLAAPALNAMLAALQDRVQAGDIRAWIVAEAGYDIYLCVKSNGDAARVDGDLDAVVAALTQGFDLAGMSLHRNGNNLSVTPKDISKAAAVAYLLETRRDLADRLLFGAGDSFSDLPFMRLTDFMLVPPGSQIHAAFTARATEAPVTKRAAALPCGSAGSGSYDAQDVRFLLNRVALAPVDVEVKERLIQSGQRHYSEMISTEMRPDSGYLGIYQAASVEGVPRVAREMASIARTLAERASGRRIALCSLVRAGVPFGVILRRELALLGVDVTHFGISIIRDKGLDRAAMAAVLDHFDAQDVVFVDGWTGKGAIAAELRRSWRAISVQDPVLAVLADPCGQADVSGSHEDWLIPSGILGGIVSGLISRSILNAETTGEFHGCVELEDLRDLDRSRAFVDAVTGLMDSFRASARPILPDPAGKLHLQSQAEACVARMMERFGGTQRNLVKPGIAEATRAVLRRAPDRVVLRSDTDPDLAALRHLCASRAVRMTVDPDLTGPYRAITLIQSSA